MAGLQMMTNIMGSYKISEALMDKLIAKRLPGKDGSQLSGVSSLELDAVVYFTTISDAAGYIEDFKISDLASVLGCTMRAAYFVLDNLSQKEIVEISSPNWYGTRNIRVLENDFSGVTDFSQCRYINTNHYFYNFSDKESYKTYRQLSLYAKRTLLIVLSGYHVEYGYRTSIDTITEKLQLKNRRLVVAYLNELRNFLGNDLCDILPDTKHRYKYGTAVFKKKNGFLIADKGIEDKQDSFFKHHMRTFLIKHNIWENSSVDNLMALNALLNRIFSVIYNYIMSGVNAEQCMDIVKASFREIGIADEYVLLSLKGKLKTSFGTVKQRPAF